MENQTIQVNEEKSTNNVIDKIKRFLSSLLIGVLAITIIGMVFLLFQGRQSSGPPTIAGHQMYIVLSGSMSPTFKTGSIIFVKETPATEIQVDDIITYAGHDGGATTTHRVIEVLNNPLQFRTRGDANNMDDPIPVPAQNVRGVVRLSIPLIGYAFSFARTKEGFLILMIIPGLIIIITQLTGMIKYIKEAKE